jgi:CMP-N,N'-diacetyllegionaminic acid synthase
MEQRASRVVVILARGGSKRIPSKNLQLIGEKPLVLISAEVASASGYQTFISSDDQEILGLKYPENVTMFQRSDQLSGDLSTSEEAILEIADRFSWQDETEIILLPPTSPLRTTEHLSFFIQEWEKVSRESNFDQAISVVATKQDLWVQNGRSVSRVRNMVFGGNQSRRSQERENLFIETSAIYLSKLETLRKGLKFTEGRIALIPLPKIASIDIDDFEDLSIARALHENTK